MAEHTVYAVASGKGGVGKTATTVNLGAALAEQGHSVVLVDADLGMANLGGYLGVGEEGNTLHEVLGGEAELEDAVYEVTDGLAVVPSGISLNGFANVRTEALSDTVDALKGAFDYVLLDIGAGLSHDSVLPLALADAVLLVSTPDPLALTDSAKTREVTERLGGAVAGTVITRSQRPAEMDVDDAEEKLGIPVLAVIPEDDAVRRGADTHRPVVGNAADSPAAEGYRGLADIVVEESLANAPVVPDVPDDAGPASEPASEPASASAPADEPASEPASEPEPEPASDPASEPEPASDPEPELDLEAEQPTESASTGEPATASEPDSGSTAEPEREPESASEPEPEREPEPSTESEPAAASEPSTESEPAAASEPSTESESPGEPLDLGAPADEEPDGADTGDQGADAGADAGPERDDDDLVPETDTTAEEIASAIERAAADDQPDEADDDGLRFDSQPEANYQPDTERGLRFDPAEDDEMPAEATAGGGTEAASDDGDADRPAFMVEGAEPDDEDDEDDEDDDGLLGRLFGG